MAMTYTSLVASKGTAGSIMNWVDYSKLDVETVVDEAQSLIFQTLRVREMRTEWTFSMAIGQSEAALPSRFLDPIGRLQDLTNSMRYTHLTESEVMRLRTYDTLSEEDFGADPFTTTADSSLVTVSITAHGLNQGGSLVVSGAAAVGGLTLNGAFPITSITDDNTLVIDAMTEASSSATGGGASAAWSANNLLSGLPSSWSLWDEKIKFDQAFDAQTTFKQLFYRSPKLLSATNTSNWLVSRYPTLMRTACQASAASYMKDDTEYQKHVSALNVLIGSIAAADDMSYRGAEFGTDTP